MAILFEKNQIDDSLPAIILCSHGPLALGMVETIRMLTGETVNIAAFTLEEGQDPDDYMVSVEEAIEAYPEGSIVFVDVLGGTPSNTIMMYARKKQKIVNCIAGFNVPILMQATINRNSHSGKEWLESLMEIENGGVCSITEILERLL